MQLKRTTEKIFYCISVSPNPLCKSLLHTYNHPEQAYNRKIFHVNVNCVIYVAYIYALEFSQNAQLKKNSWRNMPPKPMQRSSVDIYSVPSIIQIYVRVGDNILSQNEFCNQLQLKWTIEHICKLTYMLQTCSKLHTAPLIYTSQHIQR